jgi:type IV secretory pathway TrbL component
MLVFLIFSVILLVYYVGRLVTLFVGAVLSPLIILIWLVPGFRDFSETAMKTYISAIFVLFVHVVILQLAASLFAGMSATTHNDVPNTLIAMVTGLATVIALLKTQGVMMQFSYVSLGPRSARQLGTQFMNGVSYLGGKSKTIVTGTAGKVGGRSRTANMGSSARRGNLSAYAQPHSGRGGVTPAVGVTRVRSATGQTAKAPLISSGQPLATARTLPTRRSRSLVKEDN